MRYCKDAAAASILSDVSEQPEVGPSRRLGGKIARSLDPLVKISKFAGPKVKHRAHH